MHEWAENQLSIDPSGPLDESLKSLPAKWAVYAMADQHDKPIQLLSVKNLRASVKRRLNEPVEENTKKVDYRAVVRKIFWKRVDSHFESDLNYLQAAKEIFPDSYRKLVSARRAWFVQINPDAPHPRWTRTDLPSKSSISFGPILEKGQAARLVELIEDLFDLCRYHNVLVQSPQGSACAYKDMHKCPAPCDGSISMLQYKNLIHWSIDTLTNPAEEIEDQTDRMKSAAQNLKFEQAEKIKQFVEGLKSLRKNEYRALRRVEDFRYVTLQPGSGKGKARLFAITPEWSRCVAEIAEQPKNLCTTLPDLISIKQSADSIQISEDALDNIAILTRHLIGSKSTTTFIHASELSDQAILSAYKQLQKQPEVAEPVEEEGVITELNV